MGAGERPRQEFTSRLPSATGHSADPQPLVVMGKLDPKAEAGRAQAAGQWRGPWKVLGGARQPQGAPDCTILIIVCLSVVLLGSLLLGVLCASMV